MKIGRKKGKGEIMKRNPKYFSATKIKVGPVPSGGKFPGHHQNEKPIKLTNSPPEPGRSR